MAEKTTRANFEEKAFQDPYSHMDSEDLSLIAQDWDIVPVDATEKNNSLNADMSWGEKYIGSGGILTVTDYGRHRSDCETLADFETFIREEIEDSFPSQYLKVMDDNKERIANKLIAVTRENGYVVLPYFEE